MKKKFFVLTLIIMLIVSLLSVTVLATDEEKYSFTVNMTANNTKVAPGREVLITVKLSNVQFPETGINNLEAYISYDTNVFEQLTESSVDGLDSWKPSYNLQTNKIELSRPTFLKTDGEVMQISLKTKEDVEDGVQGQVKLFSILIKNGGDQFSTSPVSTSITVTNSTGGSVQPTTNATVQNSSVLRPGNTALRLPSNNTTVTPANNTVEEPPVVNNTTNNTTNQIVVVNESDDDIPYTGTESDALARIIIGVIFISLVLYIKLERMNKELK